MAIPSYERRSFSEIAVETTLSSGINDTDSSCSIASATGWPTGASGDFYIRIDSETIRVDTRSSTTLTFHPDGRGANGTTAASHSSGATVNVVFTSFDADESNYAVSETVGKITAAGSLLVSDAANSLAETVLGTTGLPLVAGASAPAYTQLGTSGIADDAITSAKIAADQVTSSEIAADAVGASEIATGAVGTTEIADAAVTADKIAAAVAGSGLAGGAGTALSVGVDDSTIEINSDALRVKDSGITSAKIADGTIVAGDIASNAVTTAKILDANVTYAKLASDCLTAFQQYTWKPETISITTGAKVGAGPHTLGTLTITDPGYNIEFYGVVTVLAQGAQLEYWQLQWQIDNASTRVSAVAIPFAQLSVDQTLASALSVQTKATGSNTVIDVEYARKTGSGDSTISSDGRYIGCTVWWRRTP